MWRAEDQLAGVREQPVRDLEGRVALADDEDPLLPQVVDAALGDVDVVGYVLDPRSRRPPRLDHPDGEHQDLRAVLAVAGAEHERSVVLAPRRFPGAVVARLDAAAFGESRERRLHLRP